MQDECKFEFSGPKTAIVASRDKLGTRLAKTLGHHKATDRGKQKQAKILGIDQTAGKRILFSSKKGTTFGLWGCARCRTGHPPCAAMVPGAYGRTSASLVAAGSGRGAA